MTDHSMETSRTLSAPDGVALHYRIVRCPGQARGTVVLLHGLSSNLTRWSEFVEHTRLKEHWNVARLDMRGHAGSPWRGRLTMETWSDDLRAVLDAEGCERAVLVGHSLGAHVALHFAARYPARTQALALIDPMPREAVSGGFVWLARLSPLLRLAAATIRLFNLLGLRRRTIPPRDLRELDERTRAHIAAAGDPSLIVGHYSSPLSDLRHFPTANYLQEFAELLRPLPFERVEVPVLTLLSKAITFTDPSATHTALARLPRGEIEEIAAYHWPLTERPVDVREAIERFCERVAQP